MECLDQTYLMYGVRRGGSAAIMLLGVKVMIEMPMTASRKSLWHLCEKESVGKSSPSSRVALMALMALMQVKDPCKGS